jgi:hypothetical protein
VAEVAVSPLPGVKRSRKVHLTAVSDAFSVSSVTSIVYRQACFSCNSIQILFSKWNWKFQRTASDGKTIQLNFIPITERLYQSDQNYKSRTSWLFFFVVFSGIFTCVVSLTFYLNPFFLLLTLESRLRTFVSFSFGSSFLRNRLLRKDCKNLSSSSDVSPTSFCLSLSLPLRITWISFLCYVLLQVVSFLLIVHTSHFLLNENLDLEVEVSGWSFFSKGFSFFPGFGFCKLEYELRIIVCSAMLNILLLGSGSVNKRWGTMYGRFLKIYRNYFPLRFHTTLYRRWKE